MQLIRGTTPTINMNVKSELDLTLVKNIWVYVSQQNKVKIDKGIDDVTIDAENMVISLTLTQEDTLALKADTDTLFQIRLLLQDDTALASLASKVTVKQVYKGGVITEEDSNG